MLLALEGRGEGTNVGACEGVLVALELLKLKLPWLGLLGLKLLELKLPCADGLAV